MPNNPLLPADIQNFYQWSAQNSINPPHLPPGYVLATHHTNNGILALRLFDAAYISTGIIDPNRLGTGATGAGNLYLADDGTWKAVGGGGGGGGDMYKATYDVDNDGTVDSAERIEIIVRNSTGSTLTKGQVVYLSGATGNRPNAVRAQANIEATSSKTFGIVVADINNNSDGYVACNGTLHDLDTSAFADGDAVWLSATTAGAYTSTIPAEPNHTVFIGYVARSHPTQGRLVILIQNGYELNELHGVLISSEANNDLLVYESSTSLWKNKTISTIFGGTPLVSVPTLAQVTTAGNTTTNAITVGGLVVDTNTLVVDSVNDRVGVGTATPSYKLHIQDGSATSHGQIRGLVVENTSTWNNLTLGIATTTGKGNANAGFLVDGLVKAGFAWDRTRSFLGFNNWDYNNNDFALRINSNGSLSYHDSAPSGAQLFTVLVNGNTLIGTTTDAGYKLDVNGTARIKGTGTTSATTSFTVQNSAATYNSLIIRDDGTFVFGNPNNGVAYLTAAANGNITATYFNAGLDIGAGRKVTSVQYFASGSVTASAALAQGVYFNNTLVAAANNDVLVGLDIAPTFTNGAFTGVGNIGLRVTGQVLFNAYGAYNSTTPTLRIENVDTNNIAIQVKGNVANYKYYWIYDSQTSEGIYKSDQARIDFYGGTNVGFAFRNNYGRLFTIVGTTGNVLINTTTDAGYKLDVNGTIRSSGTNGFILYDGTYGAKTSMVGYVFTIQTEGANGPTVYNFKYSDNSDALYLSNTAIRGVPAYDAVMMSRSVYAPHNGAFGFVTYAGTTQYKAIQAIYTDNNTSGVAFNYKTGGTDTEAMRITSAGNVGIGTTSPFGKVDVKDGEIFVTTSTNANLRSRLTYQGLYVSRASDGTYPEQIISVSSAWEYHTRNNHVFFRDGSPYFQIGTTGTASYLTINTTGNVLINTTTDAGYKLDVNGTARFVSAVTFNNSATNTIGGFVHSSSSPSNDAFYTLYLGSVRFYVRSDGYCKTTTSIVTEGVGSVDASAISQIDSTTKGFLQPRMTNAQAVAITTPATGLQVYDTTNNKNLLYNGTVWQNIATETWVSGQGYLTSTPTLDQVVTAGNSVSNNGITITKTSGATLTLNPGASDNAIVINNSGFIKFTSGADSFIRGTSSTFVVLDASYVSKVQFHWGGSASWINTGGNLLIGTTTDAGYKLDVNGTTRLNSSATVSSDLSVGLTNTFGRFNVRGADNLSTSRAITVQNQSQTLIFDIYNDGRTLLNPQGTGNVLIGTTTDAGYKLDVNGTARIQGNTEISRTGADTQLTVARGGGASFTIQGKANSTSQSEGVNLYWTNNTWLKFVLGSSVVANFSNVGNLLVGTSTDAGYKLDVNGTARVNGLLTIGLDYMGKISADNQYLSLYHIGGSLSIISLGFSAGGYLFINQNAGDPSGTTSGTIHRYDFNSAITNSSGTAQWNFQSLRPTYNFTGTYSGVVRGFYYNPTLTSMTGVTHRAIETTSGDVLLATTSGNVGVGITPIYKLDINGAVRFQSTGTSSVTHSFLFRNDNSAYGGFTIGSSGQSLSIQQASGYGYLTAAGFFIGSTNGNIWTNNGSILDIQNASGTTTYLRVANTTGNVLIGTTTDVGYKLDVNGQFRANGESILASASGNVGIGTVSPTSKLHINGADPFLRVNNVGSTNTHGIKISYNSSDTQGFHLLYNPPAAAAYLDNTYLVTSGQPYGDIYFRQNVSGTMTTRMTIKADGGNVGIGTSSPGTLLHISRSTNGEILRLQDTSNANQDYIFETESTGTYYGLNLKNNDTGNTIVNFSADGKLGIKTNNPDKALTINETADNDVQIKIGSHFGIGYSQSGQTRSVIGSTYGNAASMISFVLGGYTTASDKMSIFGTGNVVIGTTTDAGYKLDVVGGDSRFNGVRVGLGGGGVGSNTVVGNGALNANTSGYENTAIGYQSSYSLTGGLSNTAVGYQSLYLSTVGEANTAIGWYALRANTSDYITAVGYQALKSNTFGQSNTAVGANALEANTSGQNNTSVGWFSLQSNTTGSQNTALGSAALNVNSTGISNTAVGYIALEIVSTGSQNTAIGVQAGKSITTASNNTIIGSSALRNSTGSNNTAIGYQAGYYGVANTTGTNNIFIGNLATGVSATESNRTWIGNSSTTSTWLAGNVLIGTTTDAGYKLYVNGVIRSTSDVVAELNLKSNYQAGDEGGEITLNKPATGTVIDTSVTIDVYQNKLRIFESGGLNRGGYFDISGLSNGVGTNFSPTGYTGILNIMGNPPGQQNVHIDNGIITSID